MADQPEPNQIESTDRRLVSAWILGHVLLFGASALYVGSNGRSNPSIAVAVGLLVAIACTIEFFLLLRSLKHGPVRRIVSRWDKEYAFVLAGCLMLMTIVLVLLATFSWRSANPSMTGILGGSVPFGMTLTIYILCTPAAIAFFLLVSRINALHRVRTEQCINCGYQLDQASTRCPECAQPRLIR